MAHSKTFTKRYALQNCVFFEMLHLFMSLWDFVLVEINYSWFYIFHNCVFYDFGRILNSPAVLFFCDATHRNSIKKTPLNSMHNTVSAHHHPTFIMATTRRTMERWKLVCIDYDQHMQQFNSMLSKRPSHLPCFYFLELGWAHSFVRKLSAL